MINSFLAKLLAAPFMVRPRGWLMVVISISFFCGLRGYHVHQVIWTPALNEILPIIHEINTIVML